MTCGSVWNWGASKNCNFQCEDNDKPIQLRVLRRGALSMFWLETQTIDSTIDKPTPQTTKKIQQIAWKSRPSWSKKTSLSHHMLSCLIHLLPCRQFETAINLTSIPVPALNLDVKCRDHCSQQVARPCTTTAIKSIHPDTLQVDKRQSSTHWKHPRKMRLYSASSSSPAFFIRGRQSEHFFYFRAEKQTIQSCSFGLPHTGTVSSGFGGGTCLVGRLGSFWIGIYLHLHWEKGLVPLTKIRLHFFATIHWIGLRGNIQESPTFDEKNTSCI